jgi:tetratricopeptide (TPR) repeat protein
MVKKIFCLFAALSCFALILSAQSPGRTDPFPSLDPDPQSGQFARPSNAGLSWGDLAEAGLWASAVASQTGRTDQAAEIRRLIGNAAEELRGAPDLPAEPGKRGEYVLSYIHRKFLKSYSAFQTRLDTLLQNGRYNCVSSAVLYLVLGRAVGLDVRGVVTRDHAFATVWAGGDSWDVETTNPYGFDPGSRREFHDQFGKVTGFAYVPARNYRDRTAIGPLELVSLILSNRVAEAEDRGRFDEAVTLAVNRAALLAGREETEGEFFTAPGKELRDRLFNYGASLLRGNREEDALRWASYAGARYPDEGWQDFTFAAVNNRVVKLGQGRRFTEARDFLETARPLLGDGNFRRLDLTLTDAELTARANGLSAPAEGEEILAVISRMEAEGRLSGDRAAELRNFTILKTAELLSLGSTARRGGADRDWLAGITWMEEAQSRYGRDSRIEREIRNYRSNRAVEFHNRFAAAFNRRNMDEARRILNEALAEFPNERQLLNDRNTLDRAR